MLGMIPSFPLYKIKLKQIYNGLKFSLNSVDSLNSFYKLLFVTLSFPNDELDF